VEGGKTLFLGTRRDEEKEGGRRTKPVIRPRRRLPLSVLFSIGKGEGGSHRIPGKGNNLQRRKKDRNRIIDWRLVSRSASSKRATQRGEKREFESAAREKRLRINPEVSVREIPLRPTGSRIKIGATPEIQSASQRRGRPRAVNGGSAVKGP